MTRPRDHRAALIAQEADDLIEAAQALDQAAAALRADAKRLRCGTLLPTWGYAWGRHALHRAHAAADRALHEERPHIAKEALLPAPGGGDLNEEKGRGIR